MNYPLEDKRDAMFVLSLNRCVTSASLFTFMISYLLQFTSYISILSLIFDDDYTSSSHKGKKMCTCLIVTFFFTFVKCWDIVRFIHVWKRCDLSGLQIYKKVLEKIYCATRKSLHINEHILQCNQIK